MIKDNEKDKKKEETEKPANDLVFCFEAIITFKDIIDKLDYIGKYTSSNSAGIMSKSIGQKIESLMKQQQNLEKDFEKFIKEKTKKIELLENNEIKYYTNLIAQTASELRKSTNNICKSLSENPDIPKNLLKVNSNKLEFKKELEKIKGFLYEGSFEYFINLSSNISKNTINIEEKRKVETDLYIKVRDKNKKLNIEETEFAKEEINLNNNLAIENKNLLKVQTEENLLREYRGEELEASKQFSMFNYDQERAKVESNIKNLEELKEKEKQINNEIITYLKKNKEFFANETKKWIDKKNDKLKEYQDVEKKLTKNNDSKDAKIKKLEDK